MLLLPSGLIMICIAFVTLHGVALSSLLNSKEQLRSQLEKVAGVYKNPNNNLIDDMLKSQGLSSNKKLREYLGCHLLFFISFVSHLILPHFFLSFFFFSKNAEEHCSDHWL